jgi:prepilin-type N-terminal cleavage/methylation domain-containing protein
MKNIFQKEKGFTLIETLVAITIFTVSITALISISAKGVFDANFAKNKLTASYLAQEGIELARNYADSRSLGGVSIADSMNDICSGQGFPCDVQVDVLSYDPQSSGGGFIPCSGGDEFTGCSYLWYGSDGFYTYQVMGDNSIFSRKITISKLELPDEGYKIKSEVGWKQGEVQKDISFIIFLYDWRNN